MSSGNVMNPDPAERPKGSPNNAKKCYEFGHKNSRGLPCGANVIKGTTGCRRHAGKTLAKAKAEGAIRIAAQDWGLPADAPDVNLDHLILQMIALTKAMIDRYGAAIASTVEEAGGVLQQALIGEVWVSDEGGSHQSGEYTREMVKLWNGERDRLAGLVKMAKAAGVAERQIELAEQQGALLASVIKATLVDVAAHVAARFGGDAAELAREFEPFALARVAVLAGQVAG